MLNKWLGIGRLTKEPDLRYTASNVAVVTFTLAINRTYTNANGERDTDFINCVAYRKQAENIKKYVSKGSLISLEGRIQTRNYDDKDGKKIYVTEVVADNVQFLESKGQAISDEQLKEEIEKGKKTSLTSEEIDQAYSDFGNTVELSDSDIAF